MIFWQEEEEILITKRYGVGGGGVFDNQNIYGVGHACAQGERLGYQGADQQGEGHGDEQVDLRLDYVADKIAQIFSKEVWNCLLPVIFGTNKDNLDNTTTTAEAKSESGSRIREAFLCVHWVV